ncbi:MAG: SGNH/GDSL hydrolase family protein [Pseudolysinimonas sp.]
MTAQHPWTRYVAIGDSFTEGIGDPEPRSPGGHRGWADRVAEVLSDQTDEFAYANLAVRGRLLGQILSEQIEPALALEPDLVTMAAGGNDILRLGTDPDEVAARFETGLVRLTESGATVVIFNGADVGRTPVLGRIRGKVAIYNENLRALAQKHDAIMADMWALRELGDPRMWAPDRLHLSPVGHHTVARMVLAALEVDNELEPHKPEPLPPVSWRRARRDDLGWARTHFGPWIVRRLRRQSSGDGISAKRPTAGGVRES